MERRAMRTLSVLCFAPYYPPQGGGLEGYVGDLNEVLLDSRGVNRITVFTPKLPADGTPAEQRGEKYVVLRYPAFELIPNFPVPRLWSVSFWQALRCAHPRVHDVFVSHTRFFLTSFFALLSARVVRRPLIHVEHGSDFVELDGRLARRAAYAYDLTLGRLVLRRAEAVVGISRAAAEFVRQLTGRDAPVIYRGMRKARLDVVKPDRELSERAAGRPVVAFAGRLIDGKGVPDLLRALAEAQGPEAFACVVGDGPSRAGLEALAA